MPKSNLVALLFLVYISKSFEFKQLDITPTNLMVGVITPYYFEFERTMDSFYSMTSWNVQPVPTGSAITITFPPEYSISSPTCISVTISYIPRYNFTCSSSGNTVIISNILPSAEFIQNVQVTLGNILNPIPAIMTGSFIGTIGNDVSSAGFGIQLLPAPFQNCAITFDTAYVSQTSTTMVVTIDPQNPLDSSSTILINLPSHWVNDIVPSGLPITISMNCVNYSSSIMSSPTCIGSPPRTIMASNLFSTTTMSSFSFGILQMSSPSTTQPIDPITITSYLNGFQLERCTVYPSQLLPNIFPLIGLTTIQTMTVNTQVGLRVSLTLADHMDNNDDIQIIFPSEITPTFINVTGTGIFNQAASSVSGQTMTIVQRRNIVRVYAKTSYYVVNVYQIKAPPSTRTTPQLTIKVIRNGYDKMIGYVTIRAVASALNGTVDFALKTVNKITTYDVNITTVDPLTSSGMIKIRFPNTITPTLTSGFVSLSGSSVNTNPTVSYDNSTNTVTLTDLNSSNSSVPAQTFRLTFNSIRNAPSTAPSENFTVTTYYTSDVDDLVSEGTIGGVTALKDVINVTTVSVVPSSYVVSDSNVSYTFNFLVGNDIPQYGYAQIVIPSAITLPIFSLSPSYCKFSVNSGLFFSTTCAGGDIGIGTYINFSSPAHSSALASGSTLSLKIETLLTNPSDTSVVQNFTIRTRHSDGYIIQELRTGITVQMVTPSTMVSMAITRSSQVNSDPAVAYTFKLRQIPPLPANCKLTISVPSSLVLSGPILCLSLTGSTITCSLLSNQVEIYLTSSVSSGSWFGAVVRGFANPPSFASFDAPFNFTTQSWDNSLNYAIGTYTSTLQTSIASNFTSISGTFTSHVYGQPTDLQITLTPSSRLVPAYILVIIPSSFTIPSSLSCISWPCSIQGRNTLKVQGINSTNQISFTITGMVAPSAATHDSVVVSSFESSNYKIDESTGAILYVVPCTSSCQSGVPVHTIQTIQTVTSQDNISKIIGASVGGLISILLLIVLIMWIRRRKIENKIQVPHNSFSDGSVIVEQNPKLDYGPAPPEFQHQHASTLKLRDLPFVESSSVIGITEQQ